MDLDGMTLSEASLRSLRAAWLHLHDILRVSKRQRHGRDGRGQGGGPDHAGEIGGSSWRRTVQITTTVTITRICTSDKVSQH